MGEGGERPYLPLGAPEVLVYSYPSLQKTRMQLMV